MSDFKPEIAKARKTETLLKAKRALMSFLKKHIEKFKSEANAVGAEILRVSEPTKSNDPMKAMLAEMKNQEIRNLVRNADPKHRHDMISGNLAYIQAMIDAPDDIIGRENLNTIRREYAFRQDPSLREKEADQIEIYRAVRKKEWRHQRHCNDDADQRQDG